jgi:AraC-like DNA-binding protein
MENLAAPTPFDAAITRLDEEHGNIPIHDLAAAANISTRQFERLSAMRLGMSPKLYARILRFRYAHRLHARNQKLSWTEISQLSGYFDQMHLIRDCRKLTGVIPSRLGGEQTFRDGSYL